MKGSRLTNAPCDGLAVLYDFSVGEEHENKLNFCGVSEQIMSGRYFASAVKKRQLL
jgi:hypothetical protein